MVINEYRRLFLCSVTLICALLLTGCPGQGDRFRFDETTQVKLIDDNICFSIDNAQGYRLVIIAINPRKTPPKKQEFFDKPSLSIQNNELCVPPLFYRFKDNTRYIVEFVLHSTLDNKEARSFVVGVGINNNQVYNFPLTDREFARPYGSIQVSE
jgi:hypothetical protein